MLTVKIRLMGRLHEFLLCASRSFTSFAQFHVCYSSPAGSFSLFHLEMYSFSRRGLGPVPVKPGVGLSINIGCHPLDCQYWFWWIRFFRQVPILKYNIQCHATDDECPKNTQPTCYTKKTGEFYFERFRIRIHIFYTRNKTTNFSVVKDEKKNEKVFWIISKLKSKSVN